jgi:hypothetical protein
MQDASEASEINMANQAALSPNAYQRQIELCRRKKEVERELAVFRAEL